jgi:saccharopine dehydrogenase (NAD+, L-lysine-forming)
MNHKTFLILGGYGNVGRLLAQLLLQETDVRLVLAGRTREKAEAAANQFNSLFKGNRVEARYADASNIASLKQAFKGVDLVIVASSTANFAKKVATAALATGVDYLDIQYSTKKNAVLKSLSGEIEKAGRCFITEGGFHPGLPAALIRYVAQYFDRLEIAKVGSVIKLDWSRWTMTDSTVYEFLEEINDFKALYFKNGQWKKAKMLGMMDYISMDFGREFGKQYCAPMFLEEMQSIPETYPSLRETGFFVGGFNWFVDWLVLPLAMITLKIWPHRALRPMGKLMNWGLKTFSKPPYGTMLKVEAYGEKDEKAKAMELTLYHKDGYMFTAIPVAACLLQYFDGFIKKPGLWTQATVVESNRLMEDMERMGIDAQIQDKSSNSK